MPTNLVHSALITSIIKAVNLTDISANPDDPTRTSSIILSQAEQMTNKITDAMFGLQFWMG